MQHPQAYAWALVLMVALALCTLAVLIFALGMRRYPGMLTWVAGGGLVTFGIFLLLRQGVWPWVASVLGANMCLVGGCLLMASGLRQFVGQEVPWRFFAAVLVSLACFASWFTWVRFSVPARVLVFGLHMAVAYTDQVRVAWRAYRRGSPWPVLLVLACNLVSAVFAVSRGIVAVTTGLDGAPSVFAWTFAAYGAFVVGPPAAVVQTVGLLLLAGYRSLEELAGRGDGA